MPFIEGSDRNQAQMLPEIIDDYVNEENSVRVIDEYVNSLDLKKMNFTKSNPNKPGAPGYDPKDMLKLYLYGYMNSIRTSRKLEKATYINLEVIWLMRKLHPDFKTIADFRKENSKQLKLVFKNFCLICKDLDLLDGELVAIDGTKIRADNSKRNNYSKSKIDRQLKYIEEKTTEYLKSLEDNDEVADSTTERISIKKARSRIEELKQRKSFYEDLQNQLVENNTNEISTTDKDARLMENKKNGLEVNYNVQTAVDSKNKLILANEVNNNPSDQGNLNKMAQESKAILGIEETETIEVVADKGYYQAEDLIKCDNNNTITFVTHQVYSNSTGEREFYTDKFKYMQEEDAYLCPNQQKLYRIKHKKEDPERVKYRNTNACKECNLRDKCTKSSKGRDITRSKHQDFLDIVDARTQENMDKYLQRQTIVEHPFGTIKRTLNAAYFLTRGLKSVQGESDLIFLAYNLKRVINIMGVKKLIEAIKALRIDTRVLLNEIRRLFSFFAKNNLLFN